MNGQSRPEPVAIAGIGRARGLKGECIVHPLGETFEALSCPVEVTVGSQPADTRTMVMVWAGRIGRDMVCRFEGVTDRTGAEKLRNLTVYVGHDKLPALDSGAYYQFELEGMEVRDGERKLGTVRTVHNYPSADALEVVRPEGGTMIVPMTPGVVRKVERTSRFIDIDASALEELG